MDMRELILDFYFKQGVFKALPDPPRPIKWLRGAWSSWQPGELNSPPSPEDKICLWEEAKEEELLEHAIHELGHALFTPTPSQHPRFWGEYERLGEILNVAEDLRIERRLDAILGEWRVKNPSSSFFIAKKKTAEEALLLALLWLHQGATEEEVSSLHPRAVRIYKRLLHASPSSACLLYTSDAADE